MKRAVSMEGGAAGGVALASAIEAVRQRVLRLGLAGGDKHKMLDT